MQASLLVAPTPQGTPPVLPPGQLPATGVAKLQPGAVSRQLIKLLSDRAGKPNSRQRRS